MKLTHGGVVYEYEATADAGVYLTGGGQWWGSRLKWRPYGTTRRWERALITDLHPMDGRVEDAITALLDAGAKARA